MSFLCSESPAVDTVSTLMLGPERLAVFHVLLCGHCRLSFSIPQVYSCTTPIVPLHMVFPPLPPLILQFSNWLRMVISSGSICCVWHFLNFFFLVWQCCGLIPGPLHARQVCYTVTTCWFCFYLVRVFLLWPWARLELGSPPVSVAQVLEWHMCAVTLI